MLLVACSPGEVNSELVQLGREKTTVKEIKSSLTNCSDEVYRSAFPDNLILAKTALLNVDDRWSLWRCVGSKQ